MRTLLVIAFFILTVSSLETSQTQADCSISNPFRNKLSYLGRKDRLIILKSPEFPEMYCGKEWKDHGMCCDIDQISELEEKDSELVRASYKGLVKNFKEYVPLASRFFKNLVRLSLLTPAQIGSDNFLKTAVTEAKNLLKRPIYFHNFQFLANYDNDKKYKKYSQQMKDCWEYNIDLRSSAWCTTCSARGFVFFSKGKVVTQTNECMPVIEPIKATITLYKYHHQNATVLDSHHTCLANEILKGRNSFQHQR